MNRKQKLEYAKQLYDIICDEVNIKKYFFGTCEKGRVGYERATRKFIIEK